MWPTAPVPPVVPVVVGGFQEMVCLGGVEGRQGAGLLLSGDVDYNPRQDSTAMRVQGNHHYAVTSRAAAALCALLSRQCLELDFRKPTVDQVAARMAMVCRQEGLALNEATLRTLIQGGQNDIRLVLGQLQVG